MAKNMKDLKNLEVACRLGEAYDRLQDAPPKNHGQLGWIVDRVSEKTGETVARETARKWLAGESRPRKQYMEALADILGVSSGWLDFGVTDQGAKPITNMADAPNPTKTRKPESVNEQVAIKISRSDLLKLEAIGKGLFTPGEIISRLLSNLDG